MGRIKKTGKVIGLALTVILLVALIAHTAINIYIRLEFEKEVRRIKEKGEPISLDDIAEASFPVEQNAAVLYQTAFPLIDANKDELDGLREVIRPRADSTQWTEEQREEIPNILAKYNEVFGVVHEASMRPHCDFMPYVLCISGKEMDLSSIVLAGTE